MRNHFLLPILPLFFLVPAFGQLDRKINVSPVTPNGTVVVTNLYTKPVTGLLIQFTVYEGDKRRAIAQPYFDVYVNHDRAIPPGTSRTLPVTSPQNAERLRSQFSFISAVFEDGVTYGSADGIAVLVARRSYLAESLREHEIVIKDLVSQGLSATAVRVDGLNSVAHEQVRLTGKDSDKLLLVNSLVNYWVKSSLALQNSTCDQACLTARSNYITGGLNAWKNHLAAGLAEVNAKGGTQD